MTQLKAGGGGGASTRWGVTAASWSTLPLQLCPGCSTRLPDFNQPIFFLFLPSACLGPSRETGGRFLLESSSVWRCLCLCVAVCLWHERTWGRVMRGSGHSSGHGSLPRSLDLFLDTVIIRNNNNTTGNTGTTTENEQSSSSSRLTVCCFLVFSFFLVSSLFFSRDPADPWIIFRRGVCLASPPRRRRNYKGLWAMSSTNESSTLTHSSSSCTYYILPIIINVIIIITTSSTSTTKNKI